MCIRPTTNAAAEATTKKLFANTEASTLTGAMNEIVVETSNKWNIALLEDEKLQTRRDNREIRRVRFTGLDTDEIEDRRTASGFERRSRRRKRRKAEKKLREVFGIHRSKHHNADSLDSLAGAKCRVWLEIDEVLQLVNFFLQLF